MVWQNGSKSYLMAKTRLEMNIHLYTTFIQPRTDIDHLVCTPGVTIIYLKVCKKKCNLHSQASIRKNNLSCSPNPIQTYIIHLWERNHFTKKSPKLVCVEFRRLLSKCFLVNVDSPRISDLAINHKKERKNSFDNYSYH